MSEQVYKHINVRLSLRHWKKLQWAAASKAKFMTDLVQERLMPWLDRLPDPPGANADK